MRFRQFTVAATATMALLGAGSSIAHADLKLEQTITTTGSVTATDEQKDTNKKATDKSKVDTVKSVLYYKGDKQRTETGDTITIYDGAADKLYFLDNKAKTYYETTTASMMTQGSNPMLAMIDFGGTADVIDTKEDKEIAGKKAHHYKFMMKLTLSMKDNPAVASILPSFNISGDQWTVETSDSSPADTKLRGAMLLQRLPPGMGKGLKPLIDKMTTIKGIPLEQVQSVLISVSPTAPEEMRAGIPKDPIVTRTETTTLSEATLADSLFTVPSDYKKVDAPIVPPTPGA